MIWPDNTAETIAYDSAGRIASKTSRSGATQTLYYDELSRFEGLDWSENTPSTYLSYDAANRVILSDTDQVYTDTTYNAAGQLTSQTTWTDTEYPTVAYTYDQLGRRNKMTYPGGREIRYTYDNQSRVREIADQNQTLATYRYDIEGRLAQKTLTNVTDTLYEYDVAGQIADIQHRKGSDTVAAVTYTHNVLGDIQSREETLGSGLQQGDSTDTYQYDLVRQLIQANYGHKNGALDQEENLSYDPVGNRITRDERANNASIATKTTTYQTNEVNQYTEIETLPGTSDQPTYDLNGNLTTFLTPVASAMGISVEQ